MDHKELTVWKKAREFTYMVYRLTDGFPDKEKFGLSSQLQRSAVSVPSNIAEGAARNSDKEFTRHLYIALGSLAEAETQLFIAQDLNYINNITIELEKIIRVKQLILGMIRHLKNK